MVEGYSSPVAASPYPEPPHFFKDLRWIIVYFKSRSKDLKAMVPEPAEPDPEGLCMSFVLDVPFSTGLGPYREGGTSVGVVYQGKNYFHDLDLYVTSDIPLLAGREIWGAPKLLADISLDFGKGGVESGIVRRGCDEILRIAYKNERSAQPEELPAPRDDIKLKVIPRADRAGHAIKQLIEVGMTDFVLKGLWTGPGTFTFGKSVLTQAWKLEPIEFVGAFSMIHDSSERYGRILYDYLKT